MQLTGVKLRLDAYCFLWPGNYMNPRLGVLASILIEVSLSKPHSSHTDGFQWFHFWRARVGVCVQCSCVHSTHKEGLHQVLVLKEACTLRTVKAGLTLLFIMRKYVRIVTETEWLSSVDFLALSSLFTPLVFSV